MELKKREEKEIRKKWEKLSDGEKCRFNGYKDFVSVELLRRKLDTE